MTLVVRGDARRLPLPDVSVDALVCDPPYGLEFMGKDWDRPWAVGVSRTGYTDAERLPRPSHRDSRNANCRSCGGRQRGGRRCTCADPQWDRHPHEDMLAFQAWCTEWAAEALRVAKPGAHLLAFGGTRTYHRLACAIEDAGWEIRDSIGCLTWLYASGFPKSLNVSKAIDKMAPRAGMFEAFAAHYGERRRIVGLSHAQVCSVIGAHGEVNHGGASTNWERGYGVPTLPQWQTLTPLLGLSVEWLPLIERVEAEREVIGTRKAVPGVAFTTTGPTELDVTAPATEDAARWQGWGTALKPAWEPIIVARKPLAGTVAQSVLAWGTGALNVDACRVETSEDTARRRAVVGDTAAPFGRGMAMGGNGHDAGRWPPNLVLVHHPDCGDRCVDGCHVADLDAQSGTRAAGGAKHGWHLAAGRSGGIQGKPAVREVAFDSYGDSGGASRFYPVFRFEPKADSWERPTIARDGQALAHATVKPVDLCRWLVRLITPPGGLVLDMFAGSGAVLQAAQVEGFRSVGIELDAEGYYIDLIRERLSWPVRVDRDGRFERLRPMPIMIGQLDIFAEDVALTPYSAPPSEPLTPDANGAT